MKSDESSPIQQTNHQHTSPCDAVWSGQHVLGRETFEDKEDKVSSLLLSIHGPFCSILQLPCFHDLSNVFTIYVVGTAQEHRRCRVGVDTNRRNGVAVDVLLETTTRRRPALALVERSVSRATSRAPSRLTHSSKTSWMHAEGPTCSQVNDVTPTA